MFTDLLTTHNNGRKSVKTFMVLSLGIIRNKEYLLVLLLYGTWYSKIQFDMQQNRESRICNNKMKS
jgi:hypothetical protein